jgi:hypothetical protein
MPEKNPAADASTEEHVVNPAPVLREEHAEGSFTRVLEQQAAKIPSHWFLAASFGAMIGSVTLELTGRRHASRFVGMWAPSLLVMGVYNKLVKTLGPR